MKSCQEARLAVRKEELADSCIKAPSGPPHLPNLKGFYSQKYEMKSPFMRTQSRNVYGVQKQEDSICQS